MRKYSKRLQSGFYKCTKRDVKFHGEMRERREGEALEPGLLICRVCGFVGREDMSKGSEGRRFRRRGSDCE